MIISHIIGGLGNQLFQYAAGRAVAERNHTGLKLDAMSFADYKLRSLDLEKLHTNVQLASQQEIDALRPVSNITKALQYLRPKPRRSYHRERSFGYDPSFEKIGPQAYLKGYFQCEDYFASIAGLIRKEFRIRDEYIGNVALLGEKMKAEASVAVHVRRGDYTNPEALALHGMLDPDYYRAAIHLMQASVPDAQFYFFSDDMSWTKEQLAIAGAVFVSGDLSHSHLEDLHLMSCCRNNIIANSSFSWWGAWLNDNRDKKVIAPKHWFVEEKNNVDRAPESWIKI